MFMPRGLVDYYKNSFPPGTRIMLDQMKVSDDLLHSNDKFTFVFSEQRGFGTDMLHLFEQGAQETLFDTPYRHGGSYVQLVETHYNEVESYLNPYRESITEAMENAG